MQLRLSGKSWILFASFLWMFMHIYYILYQIHVSNSLLRSSSEDMPIPELNVLLYLEITPFGLSGENSLLPTPLPELWFSKRVLLSHLNCGFQVTQCGVWFYFIYNISWIEGWGFLLIICDKFFCLLFPYHSFIIFRTVFALRSKILSRILILLVLNGE